MRRLDRSEDAGVASIFFVMAMVLIFGVTAVALDGGAAIAAHRSVQNSADASALAVATDCARGASCPSSVAAYLRSGETASAPAINSGAGTVTVTVSKTVNFNFAPIIGMSNGTVHRSATAKWGTISGATTLPLTIASCEFSQTLLVGTTDITLYVDDPNPHTGCSATSGGFGKLVTTMGCTVSTTAGNMVQGQPGNSFNGFGNCIGTLPTNVLVPIYDSTNCDPNRCKGNGQFTIVGYAEFRLTGYSFNGNVNDGTLPKKCPDQQGNLGKNCIRGDFIQFVTSQGTPGPSPNFGLVQVSLIK
jgi:Flp pilus assembly protein TadG